MLFYISKLISLDNNLNNFKIQHHGISNPNKTIKRKD